MSMQEWLDAARKRAEVDDVQQSESSGQGGTGSEVVVQQQPGQDAGAGQQVARGKVRQVAMEAATCFHVCQLVLINELKKLGNAIIICSNYP